MCSEQFLNRRGCRRSEAQMVFAVAAQQPADGVVAETAFAIVDDEQTAFELREFCQFAITPL